MHMKLHVKSVFIHTDQPLPFNIPSHIYAKEAQESHREGTLSTHTHTWGTAAACEQWPRHAATILYGQSARRRERERERERERARLKGQSCARGLIYDLGRRYTGPGLTLRYRRRSDGQRERYIIDFCPVSILSERERNLFSAGGSRGFRDCPLPAVLLILHDKVYKKKLRTLFLPLTPRTMVIMQEERYTEGV